MNAEIGRLFWDLLPQTGYIPGSDLTCALYVVNPTGYVVRYSLSTQLIREGSIIESEVILVDSLESFTVEPGDFITVRGTFKLSEASAELHVTLTDTSTGEACDNVSTYLIHPSEIIEYIPVRQAVDIAQFIPVVLLVAVVGIAGMTMLKTLRLP